MPNRRLLTLSLRIIFFALVAVTLVLALIPGPAIDGAGSDKLHHFLAFYILTIFGLMAFPHGNILPVAAGLGGFGTLIEVLQGIPIFGRSQEVMDFLADVVGIALALAPLLVARYRQSSLSRT